MTTYSFCSSAGASDLPFHKKYTFRVLTPDELFFVKKRNSGWATLRMCRIDSYIEFAPDGSKLDVPILDTVHYDPLVHNAPGVNHYMTNLYNARRTKCPDGIKRYKLFGIFGNRGFDIILESDA